MTDEQLRTSLAYRDGQGKLEIIALVAGVAIESIRAFVNGGELNDLDRRALTLVAEEPR